MKTPAVVARMYLYAALLHLEFGWLCGRDYYEMWINGKLSDYLWFGLLAFGITWVPILIAAYLAFSSLYLLIASLAFATLRYQSLLKAITMLGFLVIPGGTLAGGYAYHKQHEIWRPVRTPKRS